MQETSDNIEKDDMHEKKTRKGTKQSNKKKNGRVCVQEVEKHRKNLLEIVLHSNATPIRHRNDKGYACFFCNDQYPLAADLKLHTLQTHGEASMTKVIKDIRIYTVKLDITSLQCAICQSDLSTIEQMMEHLQKIHKRPMYRDIKNHMIPFVFKGDDFHCAICLTVCTTFRNLTEHMNKHYRNYVCDICGAGFVNRDILRSHLRIHKIGTFTCKFCPKTFDTHIKKISHERVLHKKSCMTRKCGYCDEAFNDYHKKMDHLFLVHGVQLSKFKCDICSKSYKKSTNLTKHIRRFHLNERAVKCDICEKAFFSKTDMKNHMLKHTGVRNHRCHLCNKTFARKFTLNQHMRVHKKKSRGAIKQESQSPSYLIIVEPDVVEDDQ